MTRVHHSLVPNDAEIFKGSRGALYFFRNGRKVYITDTKAKPRRSFTPRRGAFQRFIENQAATV